MKDTQTYADAGPMDGVSDLADPRQETDGDAADATPRRKRRKRRARPHPRQLLYRLRDTSHALGCSDSHTLRLERRGYLTPVNLPGEAGKRGGKRYFADQVEALARALFEAASPGGEARISA